MHTGNVHLGDSIGQFLTMLSNQTEDMAAPITMASDGMLSPEQPIRRSLGAKVNSHDKLGQDHWVPEG